MTFYLIVGLFTFFIVYLLIPVTKHWATKLGVVDRPNARKIHRKPIPLSGGLAIYLGSVCTLYIFFDVGPLHYVVTWGGLALLFIGFIDDWYKSKGQDFPPWPKLLIQIATAGFAYLLGIRFFGISNFMDYGELIIFPQWLAVLATVFWIVGFINMINFLDGMDGLAGGITTISSLTLFLISILKAQYDVAVLAVIVIGASLAFLRHNFHPASIFLGDAGSMFLGYVIGVISLYGTMKSATVVTLLITLLALGVPVLDTLQVIIARIKEGSPIYKPDRRHVHHRLLKIGLSQRQAVIIIYAIGLGFSFLSILLFIYLS